MEGDKSTNDVISGESMTSSDSDEEDLCGFETEPLDSSTTGESDRLPPPESESTSSSSAAGSAGSDRILRRRVGDGGGVAGRRRNRVVWTDEQTL